MNPDASLVVQFLVAFVFGLGSFLSPCILPLVPAYLTFISGLNFDELATSQRPRKLVVLNAVMFVIGFSAVFVSLGAAATKLGSLLSEHQVWIRRIGGGIIILFGLYVSGVLKLGFFQREKKFHLGSKPTGYVGSVLVGATFGLAWTPCVGPVLGSILLYASTVESVRLGVWLLVAYSAGLAIPFIVSALLVNVLVGRLRRITRFAHAASIVCGVLLIIIGIDLATNGGVRLVLRLGWHNLKGLMIGT